MTLEEEIAAVLADLEAQAVIVRAAEQDRQRLERAYYALINQQNGLTK